MIEIVKQLAEQVEGHGIWALITTIVSVTVATLISRKLDARWKHGYDRDMERFKDRMEQDRLIVGTALSSLNAAAAAANPKIVEAVEAVWKATLRLRDASSDLGLYMDILTKEEWCDLPNHPRQGDKVWAVAQGVDARQRLMKEVEATENARPFVGELIWAMFFVYRVLSLRPVFIVERDFQKGRLAYWYDDDGVQQFMRQLLTDEEIRIVERYEVNRYRQIRAFAEARIGVPQSSEQERTLSRAGRPVAVIVRLMQRPQFTLRDAVGQGERVAPQDVDVLVAQG